ncbi:hypothetical protein CCP4SC76_8230004 [Gammaproteobacteria bacterium]
MGPAIRDHHLRFAEFTSTKLGFLPPDEPNGQAYLSDLNWALDYAVESRRAMMQTAIQLLSDILGIRAIESTLVECHHNHARYETHGDHSRNSGKFEPDWLDSLSVSIIFE